MREKILKLMSLTLTSFEDNVVGITEQLRAPFEQFNQVSEETSEVVAARAQRETEGIAAIGDALRGIKGELDDALVALYEGVFTEAEVDAMIVWQESEIGQKLRLVSPELMAAVNTASAGLVNKALGELDLTKWFGDMAPADLPVEIGGEMPAGAASDLLDPQPSESLTTEPEMVNAEPESV